MTERAAFIVRSAESRNAGAVIPGAQEGIARIVAALVDREPQPSDGPDYHADHVAWVWRRLPLSGRNACCS